MILHNVGYDSCHDADFFVNRPDGSGDLLLLILKTDCIMTLDGKEQYVPKNSFFLYPTGMPQQYRCIPRQTFANDWVHFLFENDEESAFLSRHIPYGQPIQMNHTEFLSYCIKAIANENCSQNQYKKDTIWHYFALICNKVSEHIHEKARSSYGSRFETMLIIRNKIYSTPYLEWSVDWVAHETRMSRSAFQHLYKEQFQVTFIQDLIQSRISYAKMLLRTTDMTVQDIAGQCGYRNYEHFARQFKTKTGCSPGEYRKHPDGYST